MNEIKLIERSKVVMRLKIYFLADLAGAHYSDNIIEWMSKNFNFVSMKTFL